jgi:tRNA dimethylallyltransferase
MASAEATLHAPQDWTCLVLAGPTASGKTAVSLALAERQPIEIVSVDSALVYRGMDIGTAKPSATERARVPHHLLDIRDPTEVYNAADFARDAQTLLREIRGRGKLPVLVGGTLLYFKALFEGLDDLPQGNAAVRARIEAQAATQGWPALHAQLARIDPATAARLAPRDAQRIGRALEVWELTGRPLSTLFGQGAARSASPERPLWLSLEPDDRAWLHERIARRFDTMLQQGFLDEVRHLRARDDLHPDLPAMRCVGYRQAWQLLANSPSTGPIPTHDQAYLQFRDQGIAATRQLAKRQLTWLRSLPQRNVLACETPDLPARVLRQLEPHLENSCLATRRLV